MGPWRTRPKSWVEKVKELAFEPRPAWLQNLTSPLCTGAELQHLSPHRIWGDRQSSSGGRRRKMRGNANRRLSMEISIEQELQTPSTTRTRVTTTATCWWETLWFAKSSCFHLRFEHLARWGFEPYYTDLETEAQRGEETYTGQVWGIFFFPASLWNLQKGGIRS